MIEVVKRNPPLLPGSTCAPQSESNAETSRGIEASPRARRVAPDISTPLRKKQSMATPLAGPPSTFFPRAAFLSSVSSSVGTARRVYFANVSSSAAATSRGPTLRGVGSCCCGCVAFSVRFAFVPSPGTALSHAATRASRHFSFICSASRSESDSFPRLGLFPLDLLVLDLETPRHVPTPHPDRRSIPHHAENVTLVPGRRLLPELPEVRGDTRRHLPENGPTRGRVMTFAMPSSSSHETTATESLGSAAATARI